MYSGMLEANGAEVAEWLLSPGFEAKLFSFFPCADIPLASASKVASPTFLLTLLQVFPQIWQ